MKTIILIYSIFIVLFIGCTNKQIETKMIIKDHYIYSKLPLLKIYDNNLSLKLSVHNKGDKVCIKEWDTCIPKNEMIKLVKYTHSLKELNSLYKKEIIIYNKYVNEHNSKIKSK